MGPHGCGFGGGWGNRSEWLSLWVMLMVAEAPVHGYEILGRMGEMGIGVNPGSLYRTMRSLETQGLVESHWNVRGGPARRLYRLTQEGWLYLKSMKNLLQGQRTTLEKVIDQIETLERRR